MTSDETIMRTVYEHYNGIDDLEAVAATLLAETTGLDVSSDHGRDTPKRFIRMLRELTDRESVKFNFTVFPNDGMDEMIVEGPIPFHSLCNHHIIPFLGKAYVAYVPRDRIAGLSKLGRTVQYFSKGLWTQEGLTRAIADYLEGILVPRGVAVIMRAEHMCMSIRGVQLPGALTTTSSMKGVFADHARTAKAEFLQFVNGVH